MDNATAVTKNNKDVEIRRARKRDKSFQYEEIARAYMDYLRRKSVSGNEPRKENDDNAV